MIKRPPCNPPPSEAGVLLHLMPSVSAEKSRKEASRNYLGTEDKEYKGTLGKDSSNSKKDE